jgi:hypothetical protein
MDEQNAPVAAATLKKDIHEVRPYVVSPVKLGVLSFFTFGLYETYWAYRQWKSLQVYKDLNIWPIPRALFAPIFAYFLFKHFQKLAPDIYTKTNPGPFTLAASYLALSIALRFNDPFWLLSLFSFLPLLTAQKIITAYWKKTYPEVIESTFTTKDYIIIAIGALLFIFIIYDILFPAVA